MIIVFKFISLFSMPCSYKVKQILAFSIMRRAVYEKEAPRCFFFYG